MGGAWKRGGTTKQSRPSAPPQLKALIQVNNGRSQTP
jgi:hypothetical protein